MKKTTKLLLIVLFLTGITNAYAQSSKVSLSGTVIDSKTNEPVEMVVVSIQELNLWTTTDRKGTFKFDEFPAGSYTIYSSCLGFEDYLYEVELKKSIDNYQLKLEKSSLALKEVVVTAKESRGNGTSSKIDKLAIEHIQAMSLADIMQLVPGNVSLNPSFNDVNQISIREIYGEYGPDQMGALGTAIIVNGSPMSNDANLQLVSTARAGTTSAFSTSAGGGIDLRQISTDNIESVEVIRGVASVVYGEMTSGAVIVTTKAGKSPLRTKTRVDANTKQFYVGKGFLLGNNKGALSFDLDYTNSYNDIRTASKGYKRVTGQLAYSNVFFKGGTPLSFNSNFYMHSTLDEHKQDKDMLRDEIEKSKDQGFSFSVNGNWALNKPWITNIKYNLSASYSHQESYIKKLQSINGATPIATSLYSGDFEGRYVENGYYSELTIDGKPINLFAKVTANLAGKYGKIYNKFLVGIEWRTNGNNGNGRTFNMDLPYSPNSINALRPRSYQDIPFLNQYSVFAEEKITIPFGSTNLNIQAGIRVSNLNPKGLFRTNFDFTFEPRFNLRYQILNKKNNSLFDELSIKGAFGINTKNPTLIHFFPDRAYFDMKSFDYYPGLVIMTTKVIDDTSNPALKPAKNTKRELGLDFKINKVIASITGFKENLVNGFSFDPLYDIMEYRKYDALDPDMNPVFQNGEVFVDGLAHTFVMDTAFNKYSTPKNNYTLEKEGIEFFINFGKIKALKTSIIVDGAYLSTKKITKGESFYNPNSSWQGNKYPFIGIYAGGESETRQRLNTNIRFITHIPEVKMVISVTCQVIWMEKMRRTYEDNNGDVVPYIINRLGKRITDNSIYTNTNYGKRINPIAYIDKSGNTYTFTDENENEDIFNALILNKQEKFYIEESYPTTFQLNIRLSKEINDTMSFSFFANNVLNYRPLERYDRSDSYFRRNSPFYFGAEFKLSF